MTPSPAVAEQTAGDHEHTAPVPHGIGLVIMLGVLGALAPLSIDMYLPALPALGRSFAAVASEVQLTLSAFLLGLALGQLVAGPLSDTLGRRRPLLVGLVAYAAASLACVVAPSVGVLVALRFVQGAAGAAGVVIARAIVRDLHSGVAAARYFSLLMLVSGLAPILAPVVGGQILRFTSWHGVFVILTVLGSLLVVAVALGFRETLAPTNRQSGGLGTTLRMFRRLLADRTFVGYALAAGLAFAAMFAYISGSPFVLQNIYGVSPQNFSFLFGTNAFGLITASQINGRLVGRVTPQRLLVGGLVAQTIGGIALVVGVAAAHIGLLGILPALFVVVASLGFVAPNATSLALAGHPNSAGSASGLLGVLQYAIGAAVAPLVGLNSASALPMAVVVAACAASALAAYLLLARHRSIGR